MTFLLIMGGRRDSNPRHPEPQSGALPLNYNHHVYLFLRRCKDIYYFLPCKLLKEKKYKYFTCR